MQDQTTSTHGILGPQAARAFTLTRVPPAPDLAGYIERHWIVRWSLPPGSSFTQELLPHPCVNVVSAPDQLAVHGMPLSRSKRVLDGTGLAVGTKFRPGAFSAFSELTAAELVGRVFELSDAFGEEALALQQRLAGFSPEPSSHISQIEEFLRSRLPPADPRRALVLDIVAEMLREHSSSSVGALAKSHGVSQRTLQRLFRDYVGVSPKWVLKRYRVHEAAERLASEEEPNAARLAAQLGYFDQSHFIKDFTAQVGCSPGRYAVLCAEAGTRESALARAA
jgi:AraC-like DNA-binding protein